MAPSSWPMIALGGFFALDGGAFGDSTGQVYYLGPDTLMWDDTGMTYSGLVQFAARGDLASYYEKLRWPGWEHEVRPLSGDQGIYVYPFLCAREGGPISARSRAVVPMLELWRLDLLLQHKLAQLPPGTAFRVSLEGEATDGTSNGLGSLSP